MLRGTRLFAVALLIVGAGCESQAADTTTTTTTTTPLPSRIISSSAMICLAPGGIAGFTITNTGQQGEWFTPLNGLLVSDDGATIFSTRFVPSLSETTGPLDQSVPTTILPIGPFPLNSGESADLEVLAPTMPGLYEIVVSSSDPPRVGLTVSDDCPAG